MRRHSMRTVCLILGLMLLAAFPAVVPLTFAQATESEKPPQAGQSAKKAQQDTKSVLMGASRTSTAKAAESAAKRKAKGPELEEVSKPTDDSGVTELQPIPPEKQTEATSATSDPGKKKSKSGPLKDIHGSVYGGSGSGSQGAGASAGASTKSGKTSVYVNGQGARQQ